MALNTPNVLATYEMVSQGPGARGRAHGTFIWYDSNRVALSKIMIPSPTNRRIMLTLKRSTGTVHTSSRRRQGSHLGGPPCPHALDLTPMKVQIRSSRSSYELMRLSAMFCCTAAQMDNRAYSKAPYQQAAVLAGRSSRLFHPKHDVTVAAIKAL
jgi:hypothetical protein